MSKKKFSYIVIVCLMVIVFIVPPAHSNDNEMSSLAGSIEDVFGIVTYGFGVLDYLEAEMRWDTKGDHIANVYGTQLRSMYNVIYYITTIYWSPEDKKDSRAIEQCLETWYLKGYNSYNFTMCEMCIEDKLK